MVSENCGILIGALVVLKLDERIDKVKKVCVGGYVLRVLEHLQEVLAGISVTVRQSLKGGFQAFSEVITERKNVLVDRIVCVDVGSLPMVTHPAVASLGESLSVS